MISMLKANVPPTYIPCRDGHFAGICVRCDAQQLAPLTLEGVIDRYQQDRVTQDQYEAYRHIWARGHMFARESGGWLAEPKLASVEAIATVLRQIGATR